MDRMNRTFEKTCLKVINGNVILQARMKYTITAGWWGTEKVYKPISRSRFLKFLAY